MGLQQQNQRVSALPASGADPRGSHIRDVRGDMYWPCGDTIDVSAVATRVSNIYVNDIDGDRHVKQQRSQSGAADMQTASGTEGTAAGTHIRQVYVHDIHLMGADSSA